MFTIVHTEKTNDADVSYIVSQAELHEGVNDLLSGVRVQPLTSNEGRHTYRVSITLGSRITVEEFVGVAELLAVGNIDWALRLVETLNAKYDGRITREPLG